MEPCVSCIYVRCHLLYGICENVPYEAVYFKELHNDQEYYREKSLRHVAMVAKFLDDDKPKIHLKSKFALFQTSSMLFSLI